MINEKIQVPDSALLKIKGISQVLNRPDLGVLIAQCVNLTDMIVNQLNKGDTCYIKTKEGKTVELVLPGVL